MNTHQDNVLIDSCEYTPVYLVQDTGAIQGRSYILAQGNVEEDKPVTSNLKRFYENSGIFESNSGNNVPNISKPRILQRKDSKLIGNNLKLASFPTPRTTSSNIQVQHNNLHKQCISVNNLVLKPTMVSTNVTRTVPKVEVDRKIVKLKKISRSLNHHLPRRPHEPPAREKNKISPKKKPKDTQPIITNPLKYTSVQLLKLGETYHSLNQLSDDQMKMVNQALKIFNNPEKTATLEPTYDPVTNTRFIYKVVSPKDLTVVGKNKFVMNNKKEILPQNKQQKVKKELKKEKVKPDIAVIQKVVHDKPNEPEPPTEVMNNTKFSAFYKPCKLNTLPQHQQQEVKKELKKEKVKPDIAVITKELHDKPEEEPDPLTEIIVTRSGRKVKFPKQMVPADTPQNKPKKRSGAVVSCFQCPSEFCSLYRLQKHYESHPSHLPAKVHSNLFHCLLAIVKSGAVEDRSNIFIQQLELLIEKLKSLLPCLLKKIGGRKGKSCIINEDIGRLFGMNAGKYNLNVDALDCVKDIDGNCRHNPPKTNNFNSGPSIPSPIWRNKQNVDNNLDIETEDCARINVVDRCPTAHKRLGYSKQQRSPQSNAKKMRLNSETADPIIELGIEDLVNLNHDDQSAINVQSKSLSILDELGLEVGNKKTAIQQVILDEGQNNEIFEDSTKKCLSSETHTLFHSTHFDIRSSPIKPSAAVFRKFQINPEKLAKYDVQVIRPVELENKQADISEANSMPSIPCDTGTPDLQSIFRENKQADISEANSMPSIPCDIDTPDLQSILRENKQADISEANSMPSIPCDTDTPDLQSIFRENKQTDISEANSMPSIPCDTDTPDLQSIFRENKQADISEANSMPSIPCDTDTPDLQSIFRDDLGIQLSPCKSSDGIPSINQSGGGIPPDLTFDTSKDWIMETVNDKSIDSFMKTNSDLVPSLLNVQETCIDNLPIEKLIDTNDQLEDSDSRLLSSQCSSVLNFLESLGNECLSYPETEIRNHSVENVDFQLDLFSFNNT